jgi:hypothetical protein
MKSQGDRTTRRQGDRERGSRSIFAWQGLWLELPPRWNPVKLEGDYDQGYALFADLHRARLGVRWTRPRKPRMSLRRLLGGRWEFDATAWSRQTMREEVGMLAAAEAVEWPAQGREADRPDAMSWGRKWEVSLLYLEPEPPGRDVWLGFSRESGRAVQVTHHANRREMILAQALLPALADLPQDGMLPWSVFELSCRVPAEMRLERHVLNAGDLSLIFAGGGRNVLVRQLAVAHLALKRLSLEKWLQQQMSIRRRHYRVKGGVEEVEVGVEGGRGTSAEQRGSSTRGETGVEGERMLRGLSQWMRRRRRFWWMRWVPEGFVTYALHDEARDRLVLVQGTQEQLVREVAATVGWAAT